MSKPVEIARIKLKFEGRATHVAIVESKRYDDDTIQEMRAELHARLDKAIDDALAQPVHHPEAVNR